MQQREGTTVENSSEVEAEGVVEVEDGKEGVEEEKATNQGFCQNPKKLGNVTENLGNVEDAKLWVDVIRGNRLTRNGKALAFVTPKIVNGKPVVKIEEDVASEIRFWETSLITIAFHFQSVDFHHLWRPEDLQLSSTLWLSATSFRFHGVGSRGRRKIHHRCNV
ncbi:uncharacterized protein LOC131650228 isoform X2 [Vicia villosa]|uniref:uncharacterized protein LOC131650228 isoform X2 n=1 Tax=Vicia villosa TaxID=3911 RepID=UPI00273BABB3|nr:uncharacterized protein LOC131650228 isoform X2 [Vicia villosa]